MRAIDHSPVIQHPPIMACLLVVCLLAGCSTNYGLPAEAQEVLDETARNYYTSPWLVSTPFEVINAIEVMNAWIANGQDSGTMWCVELMVSGRQDDTPMVISAVWIVAQQDVQAAWQAAALETISASSTIERCEL
ncbi:MAG: hypothetical protein A2Z71_00955 [Chloroflexi bacterium RBG_13_50_21]|nr:MAG: hypothetical protein A2Z71_00955 [Chloroflexi bacterium RBG_13_50_21]OGO65203.1 MAG: hypothetical protein A2030_05540 [Chloroflexi bacterium RBG_19FT_COMBO_50_10]